MTTNRSHLPVFDFSREGELEKLEELAPRLTATQLATFFGVGRSVFFDGLKRNPTATILYQKAKMQNVSDIAGNLIQKARDGDIGAMVFFLKTRGAWSEFKDPHLEDFGALESESKISEAEMVRRKDMLKTFQKYADNQEKIDKMLEEIDAS